MPRTFVDLSIFLENDVLSDPPAFAPKIQYFTHENTLRADRAVLPRPEEGRPARRRRLGGRAGPAVDPQRHAPRRAVPLPPDDEQGARRKERAIAIDEVPLDWCFQPGVKLDFRHFADGYVATAADVEAELKRIGHTLAPLEIVVVNTRAGSRYGQPDYVSSGCGMGYEATMYLLERGVRLTGTDAWSWDAPFVHTAKKYAETHDASLIWEGHKAGRDIGYCHLEKLHNLESAAADGFFISCFPHKIRGASAGWTRAVAIFDDALMASA